MSDKDECGYNGGNVFLLFQLPESQTVTVCLPERSPARSSHFLPAAMTVSNTRMLNSKLTHRDGGTLGLLYEQS